MFLIKGKSISGQTVIGKIKKLNQEDINGDFTKESGELSINHEMTKLSLAVANTKKQMTELKEKARTEVDEKAADIFEAYEILLSDEEFAVSILEFIKTDKCSAIDAARKNRQKFVSIFEEIEEEQATEKIRDINEVTEYLIQNIEGKNNAVDLSEPVIIFTKELSAGLLLKLDRKNILGVIETKGSTNSHTAILLKMMNVPAICQISADEEKILDGNVAILFADKGEVVLEPDEETFDRARKTIEDEKKVAKKFGDIRGKQAVTKSGQEIKLFLNVSEITDISDELLEETQGVGLYRSEISYLKNENLPSEEELFSEYKELALKCRSKNIVIRTLDAGSDKKIKGLEFPEEKNPALGYRGIRVSLDRRDIFKTQIKAICRANVFGNISIMYPMITLESELEKIQEVIKDAVQELETEKKEYRIPKQGIMIETPAAALLSDKLASKVDFFSIGTNDLAQYTVCVDRENAYFENYLNNEALLRLIEITVNNAHAGGIECSICGELAGDESMTEWFVRHRIDGLSLPGYKILDIKRKVLTLN